MVKSRNLAAAFDGAGDGQPKRVPAQTKDLKIFATIPWLLEPNREALSVHEQQLSKTQVDALFRVLRSSDMVVERATDSMMALFDKGPTSLSEAIPEPSKYSTVGNRSFNFYSPSAYAPVWKALWEQAMPEAEARLNIIMENIASLPWHRDGTTSRDYFLRKNEMTEAQIEYADKAASVNFIKESRFSFSHNGQYELKNEGQGYTDNRLYHRVHNAMEAEFDQDSTAIARLPWMMSLSGDLVVHKRDIANMLDDPQHSDALSLAMTRREIARDNELLVLHAPNTVGKIYERTDGETDVGRNRCYYAAAEKATVRLKEMADKLLDLPWVYNETLKRIEISQNVITSGTDPMNDIPEGMVLRDGTVMFLPEVTYMHRAPEGVNTILHSFLKGMEQKLKGADLKGAEILAWKRDDLISSSWSVTRDEVKDAIRKGKLKSFDLPYEEGYNGEYSIPGDMGKRFAYLPYYIAVEAAVAKNQADFIAQNISAISALPWSVALLEDVTDCMAIKLSEEKLKKKEVGEMLLLEKMSDLNMLKIYANSYSSIRSEVLLKSLTPVFEEKRKAVMAEIAAMPWQYVRSAAGFYVSKDSLSEDQNKMMSELRFQSRSDAYFIEDHKQSKDYKGSGAETANQLVEQIAKQITRNALVAALPGDIVKLPWRYHSETEMRVNKEMVSEAQKDALEKVGVNVCLEDYSVRTVGDHYIGCGILQAPVFVQLTKTADANLITDFEVAKTFPWMDMGDGRFGFVRTDLTAQQQIVLDAIPLYYWDREVVHPFTRDMKYIAKTDLPDQRLAAIAVTRNNTAPKSIPGITP